MNKFVDSHRRNLLSIAGIPWNSCYVSWNNDGPDGVITSHLNLIFPVELQEVGPGVWEFQGQFRLAVWAYIVILVW